MCAPYFPSLVGASMMLNQVAAFVTRPTCPLTTAFNGAIGVMFTGFLAFVGHKNPIAAANEGGGCCFRRRPTARGPSDASRRHSCSSAVLRFMLGHVAGLRAQPPNVWLSGGGHETSDRSRLRGEWSPGNRAKGIARSTTVPGRPLTRAAKNVHHF
jgi:hypothetical protein